jgi:hypothetical protein
LGNFGAGKVRSMCHDDDDDDDDEEEEEEEEKEEEVINVLFSLHPLLLLFLFFRLFGLRL